MDELIKLISRKLDVLEQEIFYLSDLMEDEAYKARILNAVKKDPDSIDVKTFKPLFPRGYAETIDEIASYKGWFSKNPDESQIKEAKAKLDKLIDGKMREYEAKYVSIREEKIIPKDRVLRQYKEALKILTEYNSGKYITADELAQIDLLISLIDNPDEAIDFYLQIALNNINCLKQQKEVEKEDNSKKMPDEQIKKVEEARQNTKDTEVIIQDEKSEHDIIMERLNKFLNIGRGEKPSYIDVKKLIGPKLYSITKKIILDKKDIIDKKDENNVDYVVDLLALKEYIEACGLDITLEEDYFFSAVLMELLDAYETQNVGKIKDVLSKYKEKLELIAKKEEEKAAEEARKAQAEQDFNQEFEQALLEEQNKESLEAFKPLPEFEEYAKLLKELDEKYGIMAFLKTNKDLLESLAGLDKAGIKKAFSIEDDYYKCCMSTSYAEIASLLQLKENNPEIASSLDSLKKELDSVVEEYEQYLQSKKSILDELRESGNPFNYIVLFDESEFDRTYDREKKLSPIKNLEYPAEVYSVLMQLIHETDLTEIRKHLHNIKKDNKDNPDNICDFPAGSNKKMRVTVKILEDVHLAGEAEDQKHNVIVVFHNVYAKRQKTSELQETLTTFKSNAERYRKIKEIFGPKGTKEEQEKELRKGFATVDKLKQILSGGMTL